MLQAKIVEQALQGVGYQIFSPTWIDNGDDCGIDAWAGYGSQVSPQPTRQASIKVVD